MEKNQTQYKMKEFVKNMGIILVLCGFILLAISVLNNLTTNNWLLVSMVLVVGGLFTYIITNKYVA